MFIASVRPSVCLSETKIWSLKNKIWRWCNVRGPRSSPEKLSSAHVLRLLLFPSWSMLCWIPDFRFINGLILGLVADSRQFLAARRFYRVRWPYGNPGQGSPADRDCRLSATSAIIHPLMNHSMLQFGIIFLSGNSVKFQRWRQKNYLNLQYCSSISRLAE